MREVCGLSATTDCRQLHAIDMHPVSSLYYSHPSFLFSLILSLLLIHSFVQKWMREVCGLSATTDYRQLHAIDMDADKESFMQRRAQAVAYDDNDDDDDDDDDDEEEEEEEEDSFSLIPSCPSNQTNLSPRSLPFSSLPPFIPSLSLFCLLYLLLCFFVFLFLFLFPPFFKCCSSLLSLRSGEEVAACRKTNTSFVWLSNSTRIFRSCCCTWPTGREEEAGTKAKWTQMDFTVIYLWFSNLARIFCSCTRSSRLPNENGFAMKRVKEEEKGWRGLMMMFFFFDFEMIAVSGPCCSCFLCFSYRWWLMTRTAVEADFPNSSRRRRSVPLLNKLLLQLSMRRRWKSSDNHQHPCYPHSPHHPCLAFARLTDTFRAQPLDLWLLLALFRWSS